MHHLYLKIQNSQQCAEMKHENQEYRTKYMDCIESKSALITSMISQLELSVYVSLSTKRNENATVDNTESNAQTYSITENMKPPSQSWYVCLLNDILAAKNYSTFVAHYSGTKRV